MPRRHPLLAVIASISCACYAPDLRDCTVTCSAASACAEDQVCGSDGYCAHESVAGMCGEAPPGGTHVTLRVRIDGIGRVRVHGIGDCVTMDDDKADCSYQVPMLPVRVEAIAIDDDREFDRWTTETCTVPSPSCTFIPTGTTMVGAKFR